jgi:hypothetical protein
MLCFLTHRRLKPGTYDQYRRAWEPDQMPEGVIETVYHVRSLQDPDEIISFGLADVGADDLPGLREKLGGDEAEARRQQRMAEFVESTGVDGIFEVVEEIRLGR